MKRRHTTAWALGVSLLLHGAVFVWLYRSMRAPAPAPEAERISIELYEPPAPASPSRPEPAAPKRPERLPEPTAPKRAERPAPKQGAPASGKAAPEPERTPETSAPSAPRQVQLFPPMLPSSPRGSEPAADPKGHTVRNEPGAAPDPQAVAEYQAEQARQKVQGWSEDTLAERRVESGLVDHYYLDLQAALEAGSQANPGIARDVLEDPRKGLKNLLSELGSAAGEYGRTGNPYGKRSADTADVQDRNSHNAQAAIRDPLGQTPGGKIAAELERSAPAGSMAKKVADLFLRAVVQLRQGPDGKVTEVTLLESSGNAAFDKHVLATAPASAESAPKPRAAPGELRTVWEYKGLLQYRKRLKDFKKGEGLSKAVATALSTLTGTASFEETTGDVYVNDLLHPDFRVKVKLLRVY